MLEAALEYLRLGYRVFPCAPGGKRPITRHGVHDATFDEDQVRRWWTANPTANIGLPTEGYLVIDVDGPANPWLTDSPDKQAELDTAPAALTPSGGRHHWFRQPAGKAWTNTASRIAPKVDTRAAGGYVVAPPSVVDGRTYAWRDGRALAAPEGLPEPPAWLVALLEAPQRPCVASWRPSPLPNAANDIERRVVAYLAALPPAISGAGGHNATFTAAVALVHGFALEPDAALELLLAHYNPRCEPPWSQKELEHKVKEAAGKPHERPLGWLRDSNSFISDPSGVDISGITARLVASAAPVETSAAPAAAESADEPASAEPEAAAAVPEGLLRIPGLVSEVMDHCLATAPFPNVPLAFCGALALQSLLCGRKLRDAGDTRPNLYLCGLANSGVGKNHPRAVNASILDAVGLSGQLGDGIGSAEGLEDRLQTTKAILFQTDEIDGILQSINHSRDGSGNRLVAMLLKLYSAANTRHQTRALAGRDVLQIDQPHLAIFGTAIPKHYYEGISEAMLTNGLFARMIILDAGKRGIGQEPRVSPVPRRILDVAGAWASLRPGHGNLVDEHPEPLEVPYGADVESLYRDLRALEADEYSTAEDAGDAAAMAVWARFGEKVRKLALLYAASESHLRPVINRNGVLWASTLILNLTRRMLFEATTRVAENEFHALCLRASEHLRSVRGKRLAHSMLLKRMRMSAREFRELMDTMRERGEVFLEVEETGGRPVVYYRLVEAKA